MGNSERLLRTPISMNKFLYSYNKYISRVEYYATVSYSNILDYTSFFAEAKNATDNVCNSY